MLFTYVVVVFFACFVWLGICVEVDVDRITIFPFPLDTLRKVSRTGLKITAGQRTIGTLRSNDADDNGNVIKTIGLISKTTTLHVHHTFLNISFPFLQDYDVKMPNFGFYGERKQATTKFYSCF